MTKDRKISVEKILLLKKELKQLPVKDNSKSIREFIELASEEINSAIQKGYTLDDICNFLNEKSIEIKISTLKSYLKKSKKTLLVDTQNTQEETIKNTIIQKSSIIPDTPDNEL